jgi:hypothetical protein
MSRSVLPGGGKAALQKQSGMSAPGCLFTILLIFLLGFGAYKVGEAYWIKYQVREQVREILIWAAAGQAKNDMDIVQKVITGVSETGVQLSPRNVKITQDTNNLTIAVHWTQDLDFSYFIYPLPLEVNLTEVKRWGRGGLLIK